MKSVLKFVVVVFLTLSVAAPAGAITYFDFASDTEGWAVEDWGYGTPTLSWTSWNGGALQANTSSIVFKEGEGNWAKTYLKGALSSSQDLSSTPIYSLDIWVPDNMWVQAKLGVRTGTDVWTLYQGTETAELARSTWQTISWDLTGVSDLNNVRELGVEVFGWYPTPTGNTFDIDNVSANPIPEPASLLLLGTGLVGIFGFSLKRKGVK